MTEATCVRAVLVGELQELRRQHRYATGTSGPAIAKRVALAREIKDRENELAAFDRSRAEQIGGAR